MNKILYARTWLAQSLNEQVCPSDVICGESTAWNFEFRRCSGVFPLPDANEAAADSPIETEILRPPQ